MYEIQYASSKNANEHEIKILATPKFPDSYMDEIEEKQDRIDSFLYYLDLYRIMSDCWNQLNDYFINKDADVWKSYELLLNYANSVVCYKNYLWNGIEHNSLVNKIQEEHFQRHSWYRILLNYRNHLVHRASVPRYYSTKTGDLYIDLEKLFETLNNYRTDFSGKEIDLLRKNSFHADGKNFISARTISAMSFAEISSMNDDIFNIWFTTVMPDLDLIFKYIYRIKGENQYTVISKIEEEDYLPLNDIFEYPIIHVFNIYGFGTDEFDDLLSYYKKKNYTYFYSDEDFNTVINGML